MRSLGACPLNLENGYHHVVNLGRSRPFYVYLVLNITKNHNVCICPVKQEVLMNEVTELGS